MWHIMLKALSTYQLIPILRGNYFYRWENWGPEIFSYLTRIQFSSVAQSCPYSLRHHESQHTRPPCPSPTPRVHSNSRPSRWYKKNIVFANWSSSLNILTFALSQCKSSIIFSLSPFLFIFLSYLFPPCFPSFLYKIIYSAVWISLNINQCWFLENEYLVYCLCGRRKRIEIKRQWQGGEGGG